MTPWSPRVPGEPPTPDPPPGRARVPPGPPPVRSPRPEVLEGPSSGRALIVAAHADDEVIGCGGTAALHSELGDAVRVVVALDDTEPGAAVDPSLRRNEARAGGRRLGLRDYHFLLAGAAESSPGPLEMAVAATRVAEQVIEFRPDLVYAPWFGEHLFAHHALCRATRAALAACEYAGEAWGYEVRTPLVATRVVDVTSVWDRKIAALCEHTSQLALGDLLSAVTGLGAQRSLHLGTGARRGEAFAELLVGLPVDRVELDLIARTRLMLGGRRACG